MLSIVNDQWNGIENSSNYLEAENLTRISLSDILVIRRKLGIEKVLWIRIFDHQKMIEDLENWYIWSSILPLHIDLSRKKYPKYKNIPDAYIDALRELQENNENRRFMTSDLSKDEEKIIKNRRAVLKLLRQKENNLSSFEKELKENGFTDQTIHLIKTSKEEE